MSTLYSKKGVSTQGQFYPNPKYSLPHAVVQVCNYKQFQAKRVFFNNIISNTHK
jgi:hypothetical protein